MPGKRNYWLWYGVTILTLGLAGVVWYYLINRDAKTLAQHKGWSPVMSILAVTLGAILIIPPLVSVWKTWTRVREATHGDGMSAGIQFVVCFIPPISLIYFGYLQSKLNRAIQGEVASSAAPVVSPAP